MFADEAAIMFVVVPFEELAVHHLFAAAGS
jgi:hypothetical protein